MLNHNTNLHFAAVWTYLYRQLGYKGVILGVTGNGHQPEIDLFVKSGADRVLIKPLSADQFYGILLGKSVST